MMVSDDNDDNVASSSLSSIFVNDLKREIFFCFQELKFEHFEINYVKKWDIQIHLPINDQIDVDGENEKKN